ncbi:MULTISPECIES: murein hydrolase activator EnvC family protein [Intestinimonas]|uniref:murein hydrolase activator EnvC family protein n=1 Tax=Intestinimonas TaxID=1392389 RepID=UPI0006C505CA|nr:MULTISPECIES: M23 family metallopeptidase [Intestinimonas]MBS6283602.1 peptidoglycan DD-metalloendopeptidase family protein [Oscillospiraceae bacterium]CUP29545.1 peptidase%2C M23 family [Flavonifractor plautii]SCI92430.1 Murein hydrolase activator NlpD precursor [uncultured Flavonifractor sp.]MCI5561672.1 peptidoglycan DD-metalloendopeptidase family protein [Intestinimonas massiliensis (ex Afouda et al. 2020)]MDY5339786.1 peptidoglycan DD-metalloendopeptidase family protein [Intestinimonas
MANPKQNRQKKPRKDWRRVVVAALAAFLALMMLLPMFTMVLEAAQAADTSELEQQIREYQKQQADLAAQIKDLDRQLKSIAGDKAQALEQKRLLDRQISAKVQEIQSTESIIAQYDALIADEQAKLEDTQAKEEIQYELFCKRVRAMEEAGTVSYWSILFDSADFADLLDRATFVSEIMEADNKIMDDLAALRKSIEAQKAELETSRADQQTQRDALVAQKKELDAKEADAAALVQKIQSQESEYQSSRDALKREEEEVEAQIIKKQKEIQAKIAAGQISFDPGTGWQWPVPGRYKITSTFGPRIHPITGLPGNHTGTDVAAPKGTAILAARGGVVTISTYNNSYGNYVVVQHDNGIATLYAHMSSRAVSEGQIVTQGQTLGYVGSTGSSTGNHLHLEFRVNGKRQDALNYYPNLSFTYS